MDEEKFETVLRGTGLYGVLRLASVVLDEGLGLIEELDQKISSIISEIGTMAKEIEEKTLIVGAELKEESK